MIATRETENYVKNCAENGLNLDSVPENVLRELSDLLYIHPRLWAKKLGISVKDGRHYKNYSINKFVAIQARKSGEINTALKYEEICDKIYNSISENGRW